MRGTGVSQALCSPILRARARASVRREGTGTHIRDSERLEVTLAAAGEPLVVRREALAVRKDVEQRVQARVLRVRRKRLDLRQRRRRRRGAAWRGVVRR